MSHECIKTGCWAYLEDYREWVYGDAHLVDNVLVIRVSQRWFANQPVPTEIKHFTVYQVDYWPDRNNSNVEYPVLMSGDWKGHGYDGVVI